MPTTLNQNQLRNLIVTISAIRNSYLMNARANNLTEAEQQTLLEVKSDLASLYKLLIGCLVDALKRHLTEITTDLSQLGLANPAQQACLVQHQQLMAFQDRCFRKLDPPDFNFMPLHMPLSINLKRSLHEFKQQINAACKTLTKQSEEIIQARELILTKLDPDHFSVSLIFTDDQVAEYQRLIDHASATLRGKPLRHALQLIAPLQEAIKVAALEDSCFSEPELEHLALLFKKPDNNNDDDDGLPVKPETVAARHLLNKIQPVLAEINLDTVLLCIEMKMFSELALISSMTKKQNSPIYQTFDAIIRVLAVSTDLANSLLPVIVALKAEQPQRLKLIKQVESYEKRIRTTFQISMRLIMPINECPPILNKLAAQLDEESKQQLEIALKELEQCTDIIKQSTLQVNAAKRAYEFLEQLETALKTKSSYFATNINPLLADLQSAFKVMVSRSQLANIGNAVGTHEQVKELLKKHRFNPETLISSSNEKVQLVISIHKHYEEQAKQAAPAVQPQGPVI